MIAIALKDVKLLFNPKTILTPAAQYQSNLRRRFGGHCRITMRNLLKRASAKKQWSQAGDPPLRHSNRIDFKETIFFVDSPGEKRVVIGAVLLAGKSAMEPVPGTLEDGGTVTSGWLVKKLGRTINIEARPYASVAFKISCKTKLPDLIAAGLEV